jgi:hypothetical protein
MTIGMGSIGRVVIGLIGVAVSGCFVSHDTDLDAPADDALRFDERFVGDWQITAAGGWALLPTTTIYRLHSNGSVEVVFHEEGHYFEGEAGGVTLVASRASCHIEGRWWSEGPSRLWLETQCDDGTRASIALDFPRSPAHNTTDPAPRIVAPSGVDALWNSPQGSFIRCGEIDPGPNAWPRCVPRS